MHMSIEAMKLALEAIQDLRGYRPDIDKAIETLRAAIQQAEAQQPTAHDEQEANGLPPIVAGAIFDFAGFMTTRSEVIEVGSTAEAGPVADLVKEWAESRDLDLADAAVLSWQLHITRASLPATGEPVLFIHPDTFAMNNAHVGAWKPGHELTGYIPLYTHQAPERVPMTERELELIDGMIAVQLDHAQRCDAISNRAMAEKQKGWDMERVELLRRIRSIGITAQAKKGDE